MAEDMRTRRWPMLVGGGLVLLLIGVACTWAVLTILRPAEDPLASAEHTYVEVVQGEVGASVTLNSVAEWSQVPVGINQASGIVTSVDIEPGSEVGPGAVLYSVGLRPVTIAQGEVPMFRPISTGIAGDDVRQLQQMLATLGHYHAGIDGKVASGTTAAIKRWQQSLGIEKTGVVEAADVIFVPRLPTRIVLNPDTIKRGASLGGGEQAVQGLPAAPNFWVPATEAQAAMMPAGTAIEVGSPEGQTWQGVTGEQKRDEETGTVLVAVTGPDGATLCADACGQIPVSGQTTLSSKIVTVEQVSGLVVPSSALVTTADGSTAVIDADGERVPVELVASAKGLSIVDGVDEGTRVSVPATEDSTK
ncbi:peptidoglycan-binding protein [Microbacterium sp. GXF0217]